jgi:hypothetical protein
MMSSHHPTDSETLKSIEQRSLRASYESAGREAHALGVPRSANPFAQPADPYTSESARQRRELLADFWWCGWDHAEASRSRVKGRR